MTDDRSDYFAVFSGIHSLEDLDGVMSALTPALSPRKGSVATVLSAMEFFAASHHATSAAVRMIHPGGFLAPPLLGGEGEPHSIPLKIARNPFGLLRRFRDLRMAEQIGAALFREILQA